MIQRTLSDWRNWGTAFSCAVPRAIASKYFIPAFACGVTIVVVSILIVFS